MAKNIPSNEDQRPTTKALLYPARLSIKIEGQIKTFPDKRSKRIHFHQTSSARDAKGTVLRKGRKRERKRGTQRGTPTTKNGNE